ncbi:MAG: hypothetical protein ACREDE_10845 [Thermoplasmata archaeon]
MRRTDTLGRSSGTGRRSRPGGTVAGLITLIVGLVILAVASGLWAQELWALVLAILVLIFYGAVEFVPASWLGLIVVIVLLAYLVAVFGLCD